MSCSQVGAFIIAALTAAAAFGYDADTLALYDFKGGEPGTTIDGTTVVNLMEPGRFDGTVLFNGQDTTRMKFDAERPGKYIFERAARGETPILTDPQSIRFALGGSSFPRVEFADVGTVLSSNDDWTVECFFKCETNDAPGWTGFLQVNAGLLYNPNRPSNPDSHPELTGTPQTLSAILPKTTIYTSIYSPSFHPTVIDAKTVQSYSDTKTFCDGYWHHYACVYKAGDKKFTMYLDQNVCSSTTAQATTNSVLTESFPLKMGNGGFAGRLACLRVSKVARTPATFLHASDRADFIEEKVFHWRLDGENGATMTGYRNLYTPENPFQGQFIGRTDANGNATVVTPSGSSQSFSDDVIDARHRRVMSGDEWIGDNEGSAACTIRQRTTEKYFLADSGIALAGQDHFTLDAGSFTLEFYARCDRDAWLQKTAGTDYPRFTFFSLLNKDAYHDFAMYVSNAESDPTKPPSWYFQCDVAKAAGKDKSANSYYFPTPFNWHHYAAVYDDAEQKFSFYIDGTLRHWVTLSKRFEPTTLRSNRTYQFGFGANNHPLEGNFDEIRLVRRALQPSEFLCMRPHKGAMILIR